MKNLRKSTNFEFAIFGVDSEKIGGTNGDIDWFLWFDSHWSFGNLKIERLLYDDRLKVLHWKYAEQILVRNNICNFDEQKKKIKVLSFTTRYWFFFFNSFLILIFWGSLFAHQISNMLNLLLQAIFRGYVDFSSLISRILVISHRHKAK